MERGGWSGGRERGGKRSGGEQEWKTPQRKEGEGTGGKGEGLRTEGNGNSEEAQRGSKRAAVERGTAIEEVARRLGMGESNEEHGKVGEDGGTQRSILEAGVRGKDPTVVEYKGRSIAANSGCVDKGKSGRRESEEIGRDGARKLEREEVVRARRMMEARGVTQGKEVRFGASGWEGNGEDAYWRETSVIGEEGGENGICSRKIEKR